jgi:ABC-type cobalamin/Fe3+-siderophores transport system ATPase subunit
VTDVPPSRSATFSFAVGAQEIFGVIGPNASGKTTLIRLLSKVLAPAQGEILLDGESLGRLSREAAARRIAVVSARLCRRVFPHAVEDLVLMGRFPHTPGRSFEGDDDLRAGREAMEATGVLELRRETDRPLERRRTPARDAGARAVPALVVARSGRAHRASGSPSSGRVRRPLAAA